MISSASVAAGPRGADEPYRVMVVDDSAVIRGLVSRWIESDEALKVVGSAGNGEMALQQVQRLRPEIVVLDIEMPQMDGLTALPKLLALMPDLKIVMSSTLTLRNADISLKALAAGAADYIAKPTSVREIQGAQDFQRELVEKLKAQGAAVRGRRRLGARPEPIKPSAPRLRPPSMLPPKILAIASSTGGPQALFRLFGEWKSRISLPIVITQHMPPAFTTLLAEHLSRISGAPCHEAVAGEAVKAGHVYIAPGNWHLTVDAEGGVRRLGLNQEGHENYCRPAADPMLRSLARSYGPETLVLVLTGMGQDGRRGAETVAAAGGTILAQDEASSVVWGMPGAVATAGLCSAILPLEKIGATVERMASGAAL